MRNGAVMLLGLELGGPGMGPDQGEINGAENVL